MSIGKREIFKLKDRNGSVITKTTNTRNGAKFL
jgi:hypothetical protein